MRPARSRPAPRQALSLPGCAGCSTPYSVKVALGQLEARRALQVDVAFRLGQQALAHKHDRAVLEGRDARPLEWRLLKEGVADRLGRRCLHLCHFPVFGPLGELLLELPL
eukprot:1435679-Prymnesium_polylepis.1